MQIWIVWFLKISSFFVWRIPISARWRMAGMLAWLWFDFFRFRRFTVLKNISIVFPKMEKSEKYKLARQGMQHLCYNLFEFLILPYVDKKYIAENVIFDGVEHYEKAKTLNLGVLGLSLHMGYGDYAVSSCSLAGFPMTLISKEFRNKTLNNYWFSVRKSKGTRFIEPHGPKTAFEIFGALKRKDIVVFVIDQYMGKPYGIDVKFFGKRTGTAHGLSLFAMKTEAPVVPIYSYRDENLKTHIVFEEPVVYGPLGENKEANSLLMTNTYNARLEKIIQKYPEQWMWVHRRWKLWG